MRFTIAKRFSFSAAHQLHGLAPDHPCARLHGHNYEVEFVLERVVFNAAELRPPGFVRDYRELDAVKKFIDEALDHRNLNDVLPCATTAENIADHLLATFAPNLPELVAVRVSETPKTWAEVRS